MLTAGSEQEIPPALAGGPARADVHGQPCCPAGPAPSPRCLRPGRPLPPLRPTGGPEWELKWLHPLGQAVPREGRTLSPFGGLRGPQACAPLIPGPPGTPTLALGFSHNLLKYESGLGLGLWSHRAVGNQHGGPILEGQGDRGKSQGSGGPLSLPEGSSTAQGSCAKLILTKERRLVLGVQGLVEMHSHVPHPGVLPCLFEKPRRLPVGRGGQGGRLPSAFRPETVVLRGSVARHRPQTGAPHHRLCSPAPRSCLSHSPQPPPPCPQPSLLRSDLSPLVQSIFDLSCPLPPHALSWAH